jgi:hypothetical protein
VAKLHRAGSPASYMHAIVSICRHQYIYDLIYCVDKDMPASVDEHGPGTLELTPGEAGAPNAVTLDRGSVGVSIRSSGPLPAALM